VFGLTIVILPIVTAGDALARELMDEVIKCFAAGIHNAILFYDPEIVIIQGVFAEAGYYFIETLRRESTGGFPSSSSLGYQDRIFSFGKQSRGNRCGVHHPRIFQMEI